MQGWVLPAEVVVVHLRYFVNDQDGVVTLKDKWGKKWRHFHQWDITEMGH